ncbi:MAG: putative sulfate exporter family transporter [Desulfobacteraceae bacterium]|uniref:Putative sulfate exporter family transporter n=1 Tax=Candidatus Desulfaltia bathyphila TaxID=2841697 RepID=A0A8J6N5G8_9BACT|nr:putative sulfate exporter family transporter [Candidatus Desulfaltia bathyphila]MBL7196325.1 putative sulfate exporter family transporter [Desulfobacterales bacterium]
MEGKSQVNQSQNDVVIDRCASKLSDLWEKEDYWAIWLGFAMLLVGLFIYLSNPPAALHQKIDKANETLAVESTRAPFKTVAWYKAVDAKKLKATSTPIGKKVKLYTHKPHGWSGNPLNAFMMDKPAAEAKKRKAVAKYEAAKTKETAALKAAKTAETAAAGAGFTSETLNAEAVKAIDVWRDTHMKASKAKKKAKAKPYNQIPYLIGLSIFLAIFFGIGKKAMGNSMTKFMVGFGFVFLIAVLSYTASTNVTMKHFGIGYAAWAILFGLIVSNTIGTPKWVMPAVQTEYYIKTGLVLLGAEILFGKILSIGVPGIFVAWVVTPTVLIATYIFGQKIVKMPSKTLNITISADMSVCGVSAAIATAAACRAKKEELTLAVGLSLVFTSIMMILMPAFIKAVGMPQVLGGAWMGGTIDATGAVAAAGAFLGDKALYVAATVKMIQNVLIGVIAFCVAVYWCAKVDCVPGERVSKMEIWHRFPKFVIGFIAASIVFSLIAQSMGNDVSYALIDHGAIRGMSKIFRGWFFCLAFVSIGLATNFRDLKHQFAGGKPLILYVCGQSLNLILTLLMAYIMFYKVFPEITARI